jgi:hypothetical protein
MGSRGPTERDRMKSWIKSDQKVDPDRWWYRIPDTPYAGYKPSDVVGVVSGEPWLLEFKLNRRKTIPFRPEAEVKPHQKMELQRFKVAGGRSAIVVFEEKYNQFIVWEM